MLLDGRKIGSFETTRRVDAGRVVTSQALDLSLDRAGTTIALASKETTEETPDGKPLAFRSESKLSGAETIVEGTIAGGSIHVRTMTGGAAERLASMLPPEHEAVIHLSITDEYPLAQAFVIIEARPRSAASMA